MTKTMTRTNTMAILAALMVMMICVTQVQARDYSGGVSLSIPLTMTNFGSGMVLTVHAGLDGGGVDVLNVIDAAVAGGDTINNTTNNNTNNNNGKSYKTPKTPKEPKATKKPKKGKK